MFDKLVESTASHLQGKTAISIAKMAYHHWQTDFLPQINQLKPAKPQFLFWASTSVKNPAYPGLLYVDNLIGPDTVNTVPEATLGCIEDHGEINCLLSHDLEEAQQVLLELSDLGHNIDAIGDKLQAEGLALFDQAYNQLLELVSQPPR